MFIIFFKFNLRSLAYLHNVQYGRKHLPFFAADLTVVQAVVQVVVQADSVSAERVVSPVVAAAEEAY